MAKPHRQKVTLVNELGMHLRAAGKFVQLASRFTAEIRVEREGVEVNGKSILGILSLAAPCGKEIVISTRGPDAIEALQALVALVAARFDEET
jgi:phosphocarrier protein